MPVFSLSVVRISGVQVICNITNFEEGHQSFVSIKPHSMNWRVANWILPVRFRPGIAIVSLENKDSNEHLDFLSVSVSL